MSKHKSPMLPQVPTAAEAGFAELDGDGWIGVLVPPQAEKIVDLLNREIKMALALPDVQQRMVPLGFDSVGTAPEEFSATIEN